MTTQPAHVPTPIGKVILDGETSTLLFKRHLRHTPEEVWAALTQPDQLRAWFMTTATIDGRIGGSVDMVSGPARFHWTGRILTWDPPKVYEYEWNVDPRPELPQGEQTVVRWELTPTDSGTLLVLRHSRLTRQTAAGFAPGTHAFLDRLAAHLDKAPLPDWMRRYGEVQHNYPSWSKST